MSECLEDFLRKSRGARGIYSVCSAHPWVIEAAIQQAKADGTPLLLEATSNQVNQAGGYTGMTPPVFRDFVYEIANKAGFDPRLLILGGDHLGPNPWQHLPAKIAMERAVEMVRGYVAAGFSKIHLDASMRCVDDAGVLTDEVIAGRAAELCSASESAAVQAGLRPPVYIIGTEVPTPGGAAHALTVLEVTRNEAVEYTIARHHQAFQDAGLSAAWERVIAVVVQPGVEFDHDSVAEYDPAKARHLQVFLQRHPSLVFEAHSSDYQRPRAYAELIRDGFAILKVGPALTFAMRETLYALATIERELVPEAQRSLLVETMERTMLAEPDNWKKYYNGDEREQKLLRIYSYSDRIRYYWNKPVVQASVERLISNLRSSRIPETLLSQYCPRQYDDVRAGRLKPDPKDLVLAGIRAVLKPYSRASLGQTTE